MVEHIKRRYMRLFEIQILHHYWLDDGPDLFDGMDEEKRKERLHAYDCRRLFALTPTPSTERSFRRLGCIHKSTSLGCVVAVPDHARISVEAVFEFVVTVVDPLLPNYTSLTIHPRTIHETHINPKERPVRWKENVPTLSNLTGSARTMQGQKVCFLSAETPKDAADGPVESLFMEGDFLMQLTGDQPNADAVRLYSQSSQLAVPVFVHQDDVQPVKGKSSTFGRGVVLAEGYPDDVFALIRLTAEREDDSDFSLVEDIVKGSGTARQPGPVFQVRFKNRSGFWQESNAEPALGPFPMTHFVRNETSLAGKKAVPLEFVQLESKDGRVVKLVSKILSSSSDEKNKDVGGRSIGRLASRFFRI